jgi:K+-sensing histidine kinase KdpD
MNILFQIQIIKQRQFFEILQILLDVAYATAVVHITGGFHSSFIWIYLIGVITASLTVENMGGVITGLISTAALTALLLLYKYSLLTPITETNAMDTPSTTIFLISYAGLFTGMALIANFISDLLKKLNTQTAKFEDENIQLQADLDTLNAGLRNLEEENEKFENLSKVAAKISHLDHDINTPLCVISLSVTRVKEAAAKYEDEKLAKSSNEISSAINDITKLLQKLQVLKTNELVKKIERELKNET